MNARLTALPGGNDRQPGQVSPPSAVMRQYRRQQRTDQQLVNDGIDAMRHVTDLRAQHAQAVAAGHHADDCPPGGIERPVLS